MLVLSLSFLLSFTDEMHLLAFHQFPFLCSILLLSLLSSNQLNVQNESVILLSPPYHIQELHPLLLILTITFKLIYNNFFFSTVTLHHIYKYQFLQLFSCDKTSWFYCYLRVIIPIGFMNITLEWKMFISIIIVVIKLWWSSFILLLYKFYNTCWFYGPKGVGNGVS